MQKNSTKIDEIFVSERTPKENLALIKEFPFLKYKSLYCDAEPIEDGSWTFLDDIPEGWVKAFGLEMCQEIKNALVEEDLLDEYKIFQTKEKFGTLRWYDNGVSKKVEDIIWKYERVSANTCCQCGKPATKLSTGWICPYCDECAEKFRGKYTDII